MSENNIPVSAGPDGAPAEWRQITGWARMVDGTVHRVVTTTADRIGYGTAARKNGWPTMGNQNMDVELWQTYMIYHAMFRTGVYRESFETFVNQDNEVVQVDEQGQTVSPTVPTR